MSTSAAVARAGYQTTLVITIPLIIAGLIFFGFGIAMSVSTMGFLADSVTTTGTVIDNHLEPERHGRSQNKPRGTAPEISFTASGKTYTFRGMVLYPQRYERGEAVPVRYRPDNPRDARIDAFRDLWLMPLLVLGMGALLGGVSLRFLVRAVRRRHGPAASPR